MTNIGNENRSNQGLFYKGQGGGRVCVCVCVCVCWGGGGLQGVGAPAQAVWRTGRN